MRKFLIVVASSLALFAVVPQAQAHGDRVGVFVAGAVTGKREEDGRCLVDLEIRGTKADGQVLMPGTATVRLPRRGDAA